MKKVIKAGDADISIFRGNRERLFKKIDENIHRRALPFYLAQDQFQRFLQV